MVQVTFCGFDQVEDGNLKYAVIAARYDGKWVFCRHRERDTWEIPGGHREPGEDIADTARRELGEETGAVKAELIPVTVYRVDDCGVLFFAEIKTLGPLSEEFEIKEITLGDKLPERLTYPQIQPALFKKVQEWLAERESVNLI